MSLKEIEALPVAELADKNAHLYLWVPARLNREGAGVRVVRKWGFRDVGEIVWVKENFGLGTFPRPQHEILLVCKRGQLAHEPRDVGSVHIWGGVYSLNNGGKIHSAKPPAALDLVEAASPGPYVELFARQPRLGWDSWGWGYESLHSSGSSQALELHKRDRDAQGNSRLSGPLRGKRENRQTGNHGWDREEKESVPAEGAPITPPAR